MYSVNLQQTIIKTLAFFQIFNRPLSELEIWKFLLSPNTVSLSHINQTLNNLASQNIINEKNGFYSLSNEKEDITGQIIEKMRKKRISEEKYKKAISIIKILKHIPFIEMLSICNSLSFENAGIESDIDLFIITKKKRLWTTRFIVLFILKLLKLRPSPENSSDKICASFFINDEKLNLEDIQICHLDIYLIYWIASLVPIYDKNGAYKNFIAHNLWIKKYLPNWHRSIPAKNRNLKERKNLIIRFLFSPFLLTATENIAKKIQLKIMPHKLKSMANKNTGVIINDDMLKFHDNDKRAHFFEKWGENIL